MGAYEFRVGSPVATFHKAEVIAGSTTIDPPRNGYFLSPLMFPSNELGRAAALLIFSRSTNPCTAFDACADPIWAPSGSGAPW
jgi:hypothetical protein